METLSYIQGVYIDNADNPQSLTLTCNQTGHRLKIAPNSQGFFPIFAPTPPFFTATSPVTGPVTVNLIFYNVPVQGQSWKCQ
jgi:hypothetical protein